VNSLPKTVTRQRRDCDLNPVPSAPESSTLTTRLLSHYHRCGNINDKPYRGSFFYTATPCSCRYKTDVVMSATDLMRDRYQYRSIDFRNAWSVPSAQVGAKHWETSDRKTCGRWCYSREKVHENVHLQHKSVICRIQNGLEKAVVIRKCVLTGTICRFTACQLACSYCERNVWLSPG